MSKPPAAWPAKGCGTDGGFPGNTFPSPSLHHTQQRCLPLIISDILEPVSLRNCHSPHTKALFWRIPRRDLKSSTQQLLSLSSAYPSLCDLVPPPNRTSSEYNEQLGLQRRLLRLTSPLSTTCPGLVSVKGQQHLLRSHKSCSETVRLALHNAICKREPPQRQFLPTGCLSNEHLAIRLPSCTAVNQHYAYWQIIQPCCLLVT